MRPESRRKVPRLHLVTDDRVLAAPDFPARAREAIAAGGGAIAFQLRGPRTSGRRMWILGRDLMPVARAHGVPLVVNDRIDVCLALDAAGGHLGARSLPVEAARRVLGSAALLGRSVHAAEEAEAIIGVGRGVGLDYLYGGTVFATPFHPGEAGFGARGLAELVGAAGDVPVLAIGGIREDRIPELLDTGAHGVAVVRAVWHAERVDDAVRNLLDRIREAGRPQGSGRSRSLPWGVT